MHDLGLPPTFNQTACGSMRTRWFLHVEGGMWCGVLGLLAAWHVCWARSTVGCCSLAASAAVSACCVCMCGQEAWWHGVLCCAEMPVVVCAACAVVVFNMGLVSEATQAEISQRSEDVIQSVSQGEWETVGSSTHSVAASWRLFLRLLGQAHV